MPKYDITGYTVEFEPRHEMATTRSKKYLSDTEREADFCITIPEEYIVRKQKEEFPGISLNILEYMYAGTYLTRNLLRRDGFTLHSSAVVLDGEAYLFSASSGTGKSTHTKRWLSYFGEDRAYILNDDKPSMRFIDGKLYAYGTPFSGKDDLSVNKCVPVKAIYLISRAQENSTERAKLPRAIAFMLKESIRVRDKDFITMKFDMLQKAFDTVPVFELRCNMSDEAVITAYNAAKGD